MEQFTGRVAIEWKSAKPMQRELLSVLHCTASDTRAGYERSRSETKQKCARLEWKLSWIKLIEVVLDPSELKKISV